MEQIEQEITWELQKIDNNITDSFQIITQEIIPNVRSYGEHCNEIIDNLQWLVKMLEQTGNVNLLAGMNNGEADENSGSKNNNTIFPDISNENTNTINDGMSNDNALNDGRMNIQDNNDSKDEDIEYHTANITTTGQILRLPEFSDDEDEDEKIDKKVNRKEQANNNVASNNFHGKSSSNTETSTQGNSTLQRQQRKRKVSLLLQQEYESSSSALPSPIIQSKNNNGNALNKQVRTNSNSNMNMDSSPIRKTDDKANDNTTLQFPTA